MTASSSPVQERQWLVLLAAVQFSHVLDFMMVMPLGPALMQRFGLMAAQFGTLVSAYTLASAAMGLLGGNDPIPFFNFSKDPAEHARLMQPFQAGMARRGVLLRRDVNFICAAHTQEQIDHTSDMAEEVLQALGKSAGAA